jgi:hypothetical protein
MKIQIAVTPFNCIREKHHAVYTTWRETWLFVMCEATDPWR